MKNYLRKVVFALTAAVVCLSAGACSDSEKDLASEHLLAVWTDYLQVQENMYTSELWALDYTEQFLDTGGWGDLVKARTACIASAQYLSGLSMSEEDLSDEEYAALAKAGADTSFQSIEFESLTGKVDDERTFVRKRILEMLEGGIFLSKDIEFMREAIALQKEYIAQMCQYECFATNYLLVTLDDKKAAAGYWERLPEKYPTLCMERQQWNDNETDLEKMTSKCLDQMEESTLNQVELLAEMQADLHNMTAVLKNEDIEKWMESAFIMTDTPEFLPRPDWYEPETARYLSFIENDENITYPESGDTLEDASFGTYLRIPDLSADEIDLYAAWIQEFAGDVWKESDSDGADVWGIEMADYSISIRLEEGTATLIFSGEDVTFVPLWYLGI